MTDDDNELAGLDLGAWEPPPPPAGLADAVVARMREPVQVAARELGERGGRRRWWMFGAAVAAAAVAGAVVLARWGVTRAPANGRGDVFAARATHVELGSSSAELDLGAELRWQRDGHRLGVVQPRGAATWRVGDKDTLVIDAGAAVASVEATGASLRVEVQMNPTDARVIGASAATAIAAALVTVVVYEGHVKVTGSGQTVNVSPGNTVEVRPGEAPREVLAVGAQDVEARIRALQDEIAANRKDFEDRLRVLTAKRPDDATVKVDPAGNPELTRAAVKGLKLIEGAVLACNDGKFDGTIAASLHIAPSGKVERVKLAPADASVAGCVTKALLAARFDSTPTGGNVDRDFQFRASTWVKPCDFAALMRQATDAYAAGAYVAAQDLFDQAHTCQREPAAGRGVFMSACQLGNFTTAKIFYGLYPAEARAVMSICKGNGFTEADLKAPWPACDYAELMKEGTDAYAAGAFNQALTKFERAVMCKDEPAAIQRAFMSACKLANRPKAQLYYQWAPAQARPAISICEGNGITEQELIAGAAQPAADSPRNVPPPQLEPLRITGDKNIVPDDATKVKIGASGKDRLVGSFKLCVDVAGAVTQVIQLKGTGFADYDDKIEREMKTWRYRPFVDDGKPVAVCTAVTFIYSQGAAPSTPTRCDADELHRKGIEMYSAGAYAGALALFEKAIACNADQTYVVKAFMTSCKLANVTKARRFYRMNPAAAQKAMMVCVGNGITEETLKQ